MLKAFPGFYHGRPIVVVGNVALDGTQVRVSDDNASIHVIFKGNAPDGLDEVRGEFWDIGRMKADDIRLAGYDLRATFKIESEDRRRHRLLSYVNSNRLIKSRQWEIGLSKTGYISEAGRCLVMQAMIADKPVIIVLLDSWGKLSRIADANRIKRWIEADVLRISG